MRRTLSLLLLTTASVSLSSARRADACQPPRCGPAQLRTEWIPANAKTIALRLPVSSAEPGTASLVGGDGRILPVTVEGGYSSFRYIRFDGPLEEGETLTLRFGGVCQNDAPAPDAGTVWDAAPPNDAGDGGPDDGGTGDAGTDDGSIGSSTDAGSTDAGPSGADALTAHVVVRAAAPAPTPPAASFGEKRLTELASEGPTCFGNGTPGFTGKGVALDVDVVPSVSLRAWGALVTYGLHVDGAPYSVYAGSVGHESGGPSLRVVAFCGTAQAANLYNFVAEGEHTIDVVTYVDGHEPLVTPLGKASLRCDDVVADDDAGCAIAIASPGAARTTTGAALCAVAAVVALGRRRRGAPGPRPSASGATLSGRSSR